MFIRRLCIFILYSLLLCCHAIAQETTYHSKESESVFQGLIELGKRGTPAFSHHGFWHISSLNKNPFWKDSCGVIVPRDISELNLETKRHYLDVGERPYLYGVILEGSLSDGWVSGENFAQKKATLIAVIKLAWEKYHAVPIVSWGLESPYVPNSYKSKFGFGYRYDKKLAYIYPAEHKDVMTEIMTGVLVPDKKPITDSLGYWLPNASTRCGVGRYNNVDGKGYDSPSEWFDAKCQEVADVFNACVDKEGVHIPIIFRLWHECEAKHFWWGGGNKKTYRDFYVFTVKKFRRLCPHKNILFGYCKDRYWATEEEYLDRYPGDDYVDVIGFDNYSFGSSEKYNKRALQQMRVITKYAREHQKVAALFETGNKGEAKKQQYILSDIIYNCLKSEGVGLGIVQIWSTFVVSGEIPVEDYKRFLKYEDIITTKNNIDLLNLKR